MNEPKFTPAPWMISNDWYILDTSGNRICIISTEIAHSIKENTNLIAAAPDLFDALSFILAALHTTGMSNAAIEKAKEVAEKSLAKALGVKAP